jgi:uncharacterized protein YrrD
MQRWVQQLVLDKRKTFHQKLVLPFKKSQSISQRNKVYYLKSNNNVLLPDVVNL